MISYLTLILGELVPKSLALRASEPYALWMSPVMTVLAWIARPLVWLLTASSNVLLKPFCGQEEQAAVCPISPPSSTPHFCLSGPFRGCYATFEAPVRPRYCSLRTIRSSCDRRLFESRANTWTAFNPRVTGMSAATDICGPSGGWFNW